MNKYIFKFVVDFLILVGRKTDLTYNEIKLQEYKSNNQSLIKVFTNVINIA